MEDFDEFFGFGEERGDRLGREVVFQGDDLEPHAGFDEFFEGDVHFVGEVFAGFGDAGFGIVGGNGGGGAEELVADVGGACFRREAFADGNRTRGKGGNAGFEVEGSGHGDGLYLYLYLWTVLDIWSLWTILYLGQWTIVHKL